MRCNYSIANTLHIQIRMVGSIIKKYTKDCGCECEDIENDVDRPFMCYTHYETRINKMCDIHKRIEDE